MNNNPIFSVVVPTYNRAELLRKVLDGFTQQSFQDFELIVVDDGGNDHTRDVVESYSDSRFSYHWKKNAERGAARNFGAMLAKGQWINYFDSDDLPYPNHLQTAYDFILKQPKAVVFHTSFKKVDIHSGAVLEETIQEGLLNKKILRYNPCSCNNVFISKKLCADFRFSEQRELSGTEDWLLWLKLSCNFPFYGLAVVTSAIIEHVSRSMITASGKSTEVRTTALLDEIKKENYFNGKLRKKIAGIAAEMYSLASIHYALEGNRKQAVRTAWIAVKFLPVIFLRRRFWAIIKHVLIRKKTK